jgi:hypothetical protein
MQEAAHTPGKDKKETAKSDLPKQEVESRAAVEKKLAQIKL